MNYWHIQLHPNDPLSPSVIKSILEKKEVIGVWNKWNHESGKESPDPDTFRNSMQIGDVVMVRDTITPVALVKVINDSYIEKKPNPKMDWFELRRKVKVLGYANTESENLLKSILTKNNNDYIQPQGALTRCQGKNSTNEFIESWHNLLMEKYFKERINYFSKLQEHYAKLIYNPNKLFGDINALNSEELSNLKNSYTNRGDISGQPVVLLRSNIIDTLIKGREFNDQVLEELKKEISSNFEKNVFQAWKNPFRISYPLLYDKEKYGLIEFFHELINYFQQKLNIKMATSSNLVHFDGAQNQGKDEIWFAIYNKTFKSQKLAKQLFFKIRSGFEYGLLDLNNSDCNDLKKNKEFDLNDIIHLFEQYVNTILNDNSMEKAKIGEYLEVLEYKKQIILQGPPGTGKTFYAKKMAANLVGQNHDHIKLVQFHPSYSYEDFVRGITVKSTDGKIEYITENKILADFANKASKSETPFVIIIDEINRANLPSVLGELIYALEYRDEKVNSMYSIGQDNIVSIPENLYIIGTMNTADRSVGHIDYAIKRRFSFINMEPTESPIIYLQAKKLFAKVCRLFVEEKNGVKQSSEFLAPDFEYKDVQLGHSYFILKEGNEEEQKAELKMRLEYEIVPILNEYKKDGLLLSSDKLNRKLAEIEGFEC